MFFKIIYTRTILTCGLLAISYGLLSIDCGLIFAQEKLEVNGSIEINSTAADNRSGFVFNPQSASPGAPAKGQMYYDDSENSVKYYDGSTWQGFGTGSGTDKTIASKIVAASNSIDTAAGVNPRADYTCDGTDDQVEIQAAIDDLGASGGAVYLLEGTYNISASINLDNIAPDDSGKAIIGTGAGTVLKLASGVSNVYVINAVSVNRIFISQLMLDGNTIGKGGIYFNSVTYSKIDEVWVEKFEGGLGSGSGIIFSSSSNNIISNTHLNSARWGSINLSSSNNNIINGNSIQGGVFSIYLSSSDNNTITYNNIIQSGVQWANLNINSSDNNIFSGNYIEAPYNPFHLSSSSYNIFSANTVKVTSGGGWLCWVTLIDGGSSNIISGNNFQVGWSVEAFTIRNSSDNNIFGNLFYGINEARSKIALEGTNSDNNIIHSNRIINLTSPSLADINISSNLCENNYLMGNFITNSIKDLGTNTKYTDKTRITIERQAAVAPAAGSTLDVSTNPKGYVPLSPASAVTLNAVTAIADGKAIGDSLILEGTSDTNTVTIPHAANTILYGAASRVLGLDDILTLLWNGTDWLETDWADN